MKQLDYYYRLISAMDRLTGKNNMQWLYLHEMPDNHQLNNYLISYNRYIYSAGDNPVINEYKSYAMPIKDGQVYLFVFEKAKTHEQYYIIAVQASMSSPLFEINDKNMAQDQLAELYGHIATVRQDVSNVDFIEKIIKLADEA